MYKSSTNPHQASLFWDLESMLDSNRPLFKQATHVDWDLFESTFSPLYSQDNGRPIKPIRLMVGLLISIGETGTELILKESICINLVLEDRKKEDEDKKKGKDNRGCKVEADQTAFIDSTVQEKN